MPEDKLTWTEAIRADFGNGSRQEDLAKGYAGSVEDPEKAKDLSVSGVTSSGRVHDDLDELAYDHFYNPRILETEEE